MSITATNFFKLSLPFFSLKSTTAKLIISLRTTNYKNSKLSRPPWRRLLAVSSFGASREVHSVSPPSPPPEVPKIPKTPEVDPSDAPLEFTTGDPPPLGRPTPDPGPDFPKPPLGPPPTGPEVVPIPPPPGRNPPPPEVEPPSPPDLDSPPLAPPEYVPPPSTPPDIPTPIPPDIPPPKGPSFVF